MKTPRLALLAFALPALLVASGANAAPLPTWPTVDEGFRAWPSVYFTVGGKDHRELRCRWTECNPEKNKGTSKLYLLIESGQRVQIQSTYIELKPLDKYDPRRLWGTEYTQVTRTVKAHRQNYTSQLSNFTLDNKDGKLFVVQGGIKYPATTDINTQYYSETGGKIAVATPKKMADDVIKPDGSVTPAPPIRRPTTPPTTPTNYSWCDPKTGDVKVAHKSPGAGWTKLPTVSSKCEKPKPTDGTTPPTTAPAATSIEITANEKNWLTRRQAADLASAMSDEVLPAAGNERATALKALVDRFRVTIADNLKPKDDWVSKYKAAAEAKDATIDSINKSLPPEVWGGPNSEIVGPEGPRTDIQLSKEEFAILKSSSNKVAYQTYMNDRKGIDGNPGASTLETAKYSADAYDPIALHLVTMAARQVVGTVPSGPVVKPPGDDQTALVPPLTADEIKLLTPKEKQAYDKLLDNVRKKEPGADRALSLESDRLRRLIEKEQRGKSPAYKAPTSVAEFDKLPDWHKDIFCDPKVAGSAAAASDTATPEVDNSADAMAGLDRSAAGNQSGGNSTSAPGGGVPDWAKGPCAIYLASKSPANGGTGGGGNSGINQSLGPDAVAKEVPDTVANSWFMRGQIQTFAKGALIGLVLGSLFGPLGLIIGPLIGGALFYGMAKYDAVKADKASKKQEGA